jgi:hypothetical protein
MYTFKNLIINCLPADKKSKLRKNSFNKFSISNTELSWRNSYHIYILSIDKFATNGEYIIKDGIATEYKSEYGTFYKIVATTDKSICNDSCLYDERLYKIAINTIDINSESSNYCGIHTDVSDSIGKWLLKSSFTDGCDWTLNNVFKMYKDYQKEYGDNPLIGFDEYLKFKFK